MADGGRREAGSALAGLLLAAVAAVWVPAAGRAEAGGPLRAGEAEGGAIMGEAGEEATLWADCLALPEGSAEGAAVCSGLGPALARSGLALRPAAEAPAGAVAARLTLRVLGPGRATVLIEAGDRSQELRLSVADGPLAPDSATTLVRPLLALLGR